MIETLKSKYYHLTDAQRVMANAALMLLLSAALYVGILGPAVKAQGKVQAELKRTQDTLKLMDAQLRKLKALGEIGRQLGPDQIAQLRAAGNDVAFESQVPDLLETLRELSEKAGGANFKLAEGNPGPAFVGIGPRQDVFGLARLPVTVEFEADYAGASNYIFQLGEVKRLLRLDRVRIASAGYTKPFPLKVTIDLGIFYIEES